MHDHARLEDDECGADFVVAAVGGRMPLPGAEEEAQVQVQAQDAQHADAEKATADPPADPTPATDPEPYSAFTYAGRLFIVAVASLAGFMSPFAINIYMPALPEIKRDLGITFGESQVSVTMYMVMQGLSPSFWAPLADSAGRRPVLIAAFTVFLGANLGLAFCDRFWLLLVLRMVQASGASSAIAIGSGCISDVSHLAERGTYMGYFQSGVLIGPAVGPIIGGIVSQRWDWHAVFWFLVGFGGLFLALLVVFIPESVRVLMGNGSRRAISIWRPLVPLPLTARALRSSERMALPTFRIREMGFDHPWRMLGHPDILMLISMYALPFGTFTMVSSSLSTIINNNYGYSTIVMGLCYIPLGVGSALGSIVSGRVIDRDLALFRRRHGENVQLHQARLNKQVWYNLAFTALVIANGWVLDQKVHIAAAMVFQFFLSLFSIMYSVTISTLLVDLFPLRAASVTAALNIVRCIFGAICVAVMQYLFDAISVGWTFVLFGLLTFVLPLPMQFLVLRYGGKWSARRAEKQ